MIPSLPEIIDFLDENYVENYEGMPDMNAASSVDDDHYIFIKFKSNEEAKDAIPKLTGKKITSQFKDQTYKYDITVRLYTEDEIEKFW